MWKKNGLFEPKMALKRRQKLVLICSIRNINFVTFSAQFAYPLSFPSIRYSKIFPWAEMLPTQGLCSDIISSGGLCPDPRARTHQRARAESCRRWKSPCSECWAASWWSNHSCARLQFEEMISDAGRRSSKLPSRRKHESAKKWSNFLLKLWLH